MEEPTNWWSINHKPACRLVVCQLSVLQLKKTSLEADQKEERRCESLHLYYEITINDKILMRFYYILKTKHFTLH